MMKLKITIEDEPALFDRIEDLWIDYSYESEWKQDRCKVRSILHITEEDTDDFDLVGYWETNEYFIDTNQDPSNPVKELRRVKLEKETIEVSYWKPIKQLLKIVK